MATIDPAGAASTALYTPPVQVQTPTQQASVTERPVVETSGAEGSTSERSQSPDNGSRLGRNIDTTA